MRNRYWSIVVFLLMFSCMKTTPRYPVLEKSSTFFKESVELNKKMNAEEARAFQHYMTNDTGHDYISSPSGFWYYFDLKNESMIYIDIDIDIDIYIYIEREREIDIYRERYRNIYIYIYV